MNNRMGKAISEYAKAREARANIKSIRTNEYKLACIAVEKAARRICKLKESQ